MLPACSCSYRARVDAACRFMLVHCASVFARHWWLAAGACVPSCSASRRLSCLWAVASVEAERRGMPPTLPLLGACRWRRPGSFCPSPCLSTADPASFQRLPLATPWFLLPVPVFLSVGGG
ncbi:unnamed protein product [Prorocentrum cordatum]|uniref:Uncharacterized protein n=1 Tax=Prorocentrum cordatum TaxID=2364126 RepID=A0ABN9TQS5_9DINO|nr:unnamed protein product [Polarella glacialis]